MIKFIRSFFSPIVVGDIYELDRGRNPFNDKFLITITAVKQGYIQYELPSGALSSLERTTFLCCYKKNS